eukprot:5123749-Pyramimonas_sp.AAC.1
MCVTQAESQNGYKFWVFRSLCGFHSCPARVCSTCCAKLAIFAGSFAFAEPCGVTDARCGAPLP